MWLLILVLWPLRMITSRRANRKMDAFFQQQAIPLRPIDAGATSEGFVFTSFDAGSKLVHVRLMGEAEPNEFMFTVQIPGFDADYLRHDAQQRYRPEELVDCNVDGLREYLLKAPRTTTNAKGSRDGDPANLVVAGEFVTVLSAFCGRWDETEIISLATCWKTARAFLMGSEYRYSPISPLFLYGRSQDFALQRIRESINERLHLRLWRTPLRFEGAPVWIGQVSRDIGVRFTWRTWNLTTHRIDPDVDEARDYVIQDLLEAERVVMAGYLEGVGACDSSSPRCNLTGDIYFTDGKRAAVLVSERRTTPKFVRW
jgi:hypothetical protein